MTSIMSRSGMIFWGFNPPPECAYAIKELTYDKFKIVTWAEVFKKRKEKQKYRLEIIRGNFYRPHLYRVDVTYFDQFLFGGWQASIENIHESVWIDRDRKHLIPILMKLFPLLLPMGDKKEQWHFWKIEFARRYKKRKHHGEPVGVAYVWWDRHNEMKF